MSGWEYKVVPAPKKGVKGAGVKGPEERFANAMEVLMNDMGAQGWEYQRSETLPSMERSGLTGSTTEWRNLLVFRRAIEEAIDAFEPELLPAPEAVAAMAASEAVVAPQNEAPNQAVDNVAPVSHEETAQVEPAATSEQVTSDTHVLEASERPADAHNNDVSRLADKLPSFENFRRQRFSESSES